MNQFSFSLSQLPHIIDNNFFKNGPAPTVFCAYGPLGAGKTTFAKELAAFLGVKTPVISPTFNYVNVYQVPLGGLNFAKTLGGPALFIHFDLYRLSSYAEFVNLGLLEILYKQNAVVFIEWPEVLCQSFDLTRLESCVFKLTFAHDLASADRRNLTIEQLK